MWVCLPSCQDIGTWSALSEPALCPYLPSGNGDACLVDMERRASVTDPVDSRYLPQWQAVFHLSPPPLLPCTSGALSGAPHPTFQPFQPCSLVPLVCLSHTLHNPSVPVTLVFLKKLKFRLVLKENLMLEWWVLVGLVNTQ